MNILIMGAGAIGSYFGGMLSRKSNVEFIARKSHVDKINKNGLKIKGKTNLNLKIKAYKSVNELKKNFDLIILSVKSYDTEKAIKEVKKFLSKDTAVMSLQNGLGNIEIISKYVPSEKILACVTSNGVIFEKPGLIRHTGLGYTKVGSISNKKSNLVDEIVKIFNNSGIKTEKSNYIKKEIWIKTIVNSSINPLTTFFKCKNGYLIKNPVLKKLVEQICKESTDIAKTYGINLEFEDMFKKTISVIEDTKENYSSMLQSYLFSKPPEIDSINGYLVNIGKDKKVKTVLNEMVVYSVNLLYYK